MKFNYKAGHGENMILDIGCGYNKRRGSLGVDADIKSSADIINNLNHFPYPFKNGSILEIYITDTLSDNSNQAELAY